MLNLCELRRAVRILEKRLSGARLRRIMQPDQYRLFLSFDGSSAKQLILLSCEPEFARVCTAEELPEPISVPLSFCQYLRAHLAGSPFAGIEIADEDRQVRLRLQAQESDFVLVLSIMGARSNIYLLDGVETLVHSMRRLDETRRELKMGELWKNPQGGTRSQGTDRWEEVPDDLYLETIDETYRRLERRRKVQLLARRIEGALIKETSFLGRKAVNLQEDLGEARQAEAHRRRGELLKSVLHTIRPGDDKASALDHETGEVVEIALDPRASPAGNLESYFARYQKESRGIRVIEQQIEELRSSRSEIEALNERLRSLLGGEEPDLTALEALASEPRIRRLISRYYPSRKPQASHAKPAGNKEIPSRLLPKRYRTEDGLEIWVGRSDEGNDYLTTRLARGNDLFFHLEGYPGSHVVLRTEGRLDPPPRSILDACEITVHFSKLKHAGSADIHVAHIKEVKKPKGAKPGLVYVRHGKTVHLRRDAKRLQNILASRLDD